MRASNADVVAKEIQEYKAEVERKLKGMVAMFAYQTAQIVQEQTPIGSASSLEAGDSGEKPYDTYFALYQKRQREYGIDIDVGFHKGAITFSEDSNFEFNPDIQDDYAALNDVYEAAENRYQIGETFYIGASGPGYDFLDKKNGAKGSDQAPNGIVEPSLPRIYAIDNKVNYDGTE